MRTDLSEKDAAIMGNVGCAAVDQAREREGDDRVVRKDMRSTGF